MTVSKGQRWKKRSDALRPGSGLAGNLAPAPQRRRPHPSPLTINSGFLTLKRLSQILAMNALSPEEKQAWALFDLSPDTDLSLVKKRYNELAKSLHPDHNRDDPKAEEKLKEINLAYSVLRKNAVKENI